MPLFEHFLRRAIVVLPALSLLGHPLNNDPLPAPETLVAEAPIWGANHGEHGYAFLPITIHGHAATVVINLNNEGDLSLSTAALTKIGVTLANTATQLDVLLIGHDVQHQIPLHIIQKATWAVQGPESLPPVVGIVGVHFLTTRYDLLYDFPGRRVRLYAFRPGSTGKPSAWLPPGIKATDCGRLIPIPPGAATFTGMEVRIDNHLVTGVIEMEPYGSEEAGDEKMNQGAVDALGLPAVSPRIQPQNRPSFVYNGRLVKDQVEDVHISIGSRTFWTGPVKIFPILDVESGLPPKTPVMLLNLVTIRRGVLFNSVSSGRVCLSHS